MLDKGKPKESTSYVGSSFFDVFTSITRFYDCKKGIEVGCQQGGSAIAIAKGLPSDGYMYVYDKFADKYDMPPYGPTHASREKTLKNMEEANLSCQFSVEIADAYELDKLHEETDCIHIDIGNTYPILQKLLPPWLEKTKHVIFLEGGIPNKWQRDYGYVCYRPLLEEPLVKDHWDHITLHRNDHNSLTILTRNS